jgi:leucine dehydrogenase
VNGFEELLAEWEGETAVIRRDRPTGGWMFVCIHSTRRGPAGGGTRMKTYASPADGLADAMRLSGAMTRKLAVARLPFGGGKGVIVVPEIPRGQRRRELFERYGDLIESLGGTYRTSSDMNTDEADMDVVWERTRYVFGRSVKAGGAGSPAPPTAVGVFHGIRASVEEVYGTDDLRDRGILVQGAGGVGSRLAELLSDAGATVLVADVDRDRAEAVATRVRGEVVGADQVLDAGCDVFAPCAVGGVLSTETADRLSCRIVAGSANNQLGEPEAADALRARGILYAPDFVVNAGGAIAVVGLEQLDWSDAELDVALAGIGDTLREIYREADARDTSTAAAAEAVVEQRLR